MNRPYGRAASGALFVALLAVFAFVLPRMKVEMSMARFLPRTDDGKVAVLARSIAESEFSSALVLDVSGGTLDARTRTARALAARLSTLPTTKTVRGAPEEADESAAAEFVAAYPPTAFVPASEILRVSADARARRAKDDLLGPMGSLAAKALPRDPYGATLDLVRALESAEGARLTVVDGALVSGDGEHAFLFWTPEGSAFDAPRQAVAMRELDRAFAESRVSPELRLETSGAAKYAIASERDIRRDIERIGTLSTLGVLALFAVFFHSLRLMLLSLVPLAVGIAVATLGSYVAFGEVHGLTLAFGSSLLGVGIDYAEHYFAHFALDPKRGAGATMRAVWPSLVLGAATTAIGFLAIGWADFPCAKEMAFFSCLAVMGALVGTRLLPPWMPLAYSTPTVSTRLEGFAQRLTARAAPGGLALRRGAVFALLAALSLGALRLRFADDPSSLLALDPDLVSEDRRVQARVTLADPGRFVVVTGETDEVALERLERASLALDEMKAEGLLAHYLPLGHLVRSVRAQRESLEAARGVRANLVAAMVAEGFRAEAFEPYVRLLDEGRTFTLDEFLRSAFGRPFRPFAPHLEGARAFVLPVGGVRDVAALRARLQGATLVDETSILEGAYRHVRRRVFQALGAGLVLVFGLLFARYRSLGTTTAALLPGVLASLVLLALLSLFGVAVNILHVIGLVLVISMGVDYGIFVVEGRHSPKDVARSLVSIFTATLTTILSFGLLAISPNPALRALGVTCALGTTVAFVISPVALALFAPAKEAE